MRYPQNQERLVNKEKRIPTFLGIGLVLALVAALLLVRRVVVFRSGASGETVPKEVKLTNITSGSFVVSWLTTKKTSGLLGLLDNGQERLFPDTRDKTGELAKFTTHYIVVDGLEGDSQYEFIIISGGQKFYDSRENPYRAHTAKSISGELPKANLASGVVKTLDGASAKGAIAYVAIDGIAPLSSLVTSQGNWVISLAKAFSSDLSQLANYQEGHILEEIYVQGGEMGVATALVYTEDDDPVSTITLGSQYDFTDKNGSSAIVVPTSTAESKLAVGEEWESLSRPFEIINPNDGEMINFPRPEIFGFGPRGGKVKIVLKSPVTHEAEVEIDDLGNWRWSPPQNLIPGSHTLRIKYTDPDTGEEEDFIRTFVLAASIDEDQPSFSSTPSGATATLTPTLTPTVVPTATIVLSPTASPTAILTVTATPPPRTSQPSTESGVPESGFWEPTFIFISGSVILFLVLALGWI